MYGCHHHPSRQRRVPNELVLRAATAAYLGRYRGQTRLHSESDLRVFLHWCTEQELDLLAAVRVDIEQYLRREGRQPVARAWRTPAATVPGNTGRLGNPIQLPGWAQGSDATNRAPGCSACSTTKVSGDQALAWQ